MAFRKGSTTVGRVAFIAVMKLFFRLLLPLVLFASPAVRAAVYDIGGQKIEIPEPYGYVAADRSLPRYEEMKRLTTDKYNDTVVLLISGDDAEAIRSGNVPEMTHYCLVKHPKGYDTTPVTSDGFALIKATLKNSNAKFWAKVAKEGNKELSSMDLDRLIKISDVVPMDPHYETDSVLSYSSLIKLNKGQESEAIVNVTTTMMNVNGTVVNLYVYFPREELDASEAFAKEWSDAVLKGNGCQAQALPVAATPAARESPPTDFDWNEVLIAAIAGALLVTVIFGVRSFLARKKSK
jgi:hypothetical protein